MSRSTTTTSPRRSTSRRPQRRHEAALELRYQGCHQVAPKICFPPQKKQLSVASAQSRRGRGRRLPEPAGATPWPAPPPAPCLATAAAAGSNRHSCSRPSPPARTRCSRGSPCRRATTCIATRRISRRRPMPAASSCEAPRWPRGEGAYRREFRRDHGVFRPGRRADPADAPIHGGANPDTSMPASRAASNSVCYPVMHRQRRRWIAAGRRVALRMPRRNPPVPRRRRPTRRRRTDSGGALPAGAGAAPCGWCSCVFFLAGLGLAFTPCVFPMIPILSGIIAGAGEHIATVAPCVLSAGLRPGQRGHLHHRRRHRRARRQEPAGRVPDAMGAVALSPACSCCWRCPCSASTSCSCPTRWQSKLAERQQPPVRRLACSAWRSWARCRP